MQQFARITLIAFLIGAAGIGFEEARQGIAAHGIRAHLYFLSHDALGGRAPGSPGGELAAEYIAAQFMRMGLEPVNGSYFQPVPLLGITTDPTSLSIAFESRTDRLPARFGSDAIVWPGAPHPRISVSGELVFVGYGIEARDWAWDDFKGRDLTGKVLVFLGGDPPAPPDEPNLFAGRALTYYGRWTYKMEEARRRGATGALIIHTTETAGYPWSVVESSWSGEQFMLAGVESGQPLLLQGWVTRDHARLLFGLGGLDLDELYVRSTRRDFRPVTTGIVIRSRMNSRVRELETRNVVGYLPGSHPQRGSEVVVLTAHYDHLGTGVVVDGDSIYNGAYDNASGVALMLEVANAFARLQPGTDRGLLFIATAAEEAGLLGSHYYVRHPLVPIDRTVAALNVDGANLWGETEDISVLGGERTTLAELLPARAADLGLTLAPDLAPEKGAFYRSDHFPFARAGVPALYIQHGIQFRGRPEGWGETVLSEYDARHYHRPSDRYDPAFDLTGAVQQGRFLFSIAYDIANWDRVAEWNPGMAIRAPSAGR